MSKDIADHIENMSKAEFDYWEEQVERLEHPERFATNCPSGEGAEDAEDYRTTSAIGDG